MKIEVTMDGIKMIPETSADCYRLGIITGSCSFNHTVDLNATTSELKYMEVKCEDLIVALTGATK